MSILWLGVVAGLGLAIPVGAMSIMLFQTSATKGWRSGAAGGAAMATIDFGYALATALLGAALAQFVSTWGTLLSACGALILLALGLNTVIKAIRQRNTELSEKTVRQGSPLKTFFTFAGATAINPQTALYFLAIAPSIAASDASTASLLGPLTFAAGVFLGSVAWQQVLAFAGSLLHKRSSNNLRFVTGLVGGGLVVALAVVMLTRAIA